MNDTMRSVAVGVAFAVGGLVVAGVAVAVVRARRRPQAVVVSAQPQDGAPTTGDVTGATGGFGIDPAAGVPADMRPDDPSYGPVV